MKVVFIDNFGSFNYNLIEMLEKKECEVTVFRSDLDFNTISNEIKRIKPNIIFIGSGSSISCAKVSVEIIDAFHKKIPIVGVGLGNECIIKAFDGKVGKAMLKFGKQCKIMHDGKTIFNGLDKSFSASAYHSLVAVETPYALEVSSRNEDSVIMSVRHKEYFVEGIQFDPGSILTPEGSKIIDNILSEVKSR